MALTGSGQITVEDIRAECASCGFTPTADITMQLLEEFPFWDAEVSPDLGHEVIVGNKKPYQMSDFYNAVCGDNKVQFQPKLKIDIVTYPSLKTIRLTNLKIEAQTPYAKVWNMGQADIISPSTTQVEFVNGTRLEFGMGDGRLDVHKFTIVVDPDHHPTIEKVILTRAGKLDAGTYILKRSDGTTYFNVLDSVDMVRSLDEHTYVMHIDEYAIAGLHSAFYNAFEFLCVPLLRELTWDIDIQNEGTSTISIEVDTLTIEAVMHSDATNGEAVSTANFTTSVGATSTTKLSTTKDLGDNDVYAIRVIVDFAAGGTDLRPKQVLLKGTGSPLSTLEQMTSKGGSLMSTGTYYPMVRKVNPDDGQSDNSWEYWCWIASPALKSDLDLHFYCKVITGQTKFTGTLQIHNLSASYGAIEIDSSSIANLPHVGSSGIDLNASNVAIGTGGTAYSRNVFIESRERGQLKKVTISFTHVALGGGQIVSSCVAKLVSKDADTQIRFSTSETSALSDISVGDENACTQSSNTWSFDFWVWSPNYSANIDADAGIESSLGLDPESGADINAKFEFRILTGVPL